MSVLVGITFSAQLPDRSREAQRRCLFSSRAEVDSYLLTGITLFIFPTYEETTKETFLDWIGFLLNYIIYEC